jgi:LysR family glycine cleavage system transcriptional activator
VASPHAGWFAARLPPKDRHSVKVRVCCPPIQGNSPIACHLHPTLRLASVHNFTPPRTAPPTHLPPLPAIMAFQVAVRMGSFELAGEALCITASAVSKRIASLEQRLGTRLLERTGHGLQATAAGLEYIEQVTSALALLANLPLHRCTQRPRRMLRLCSPPTFAREIVVPHLREFATSHPEIDIEIVLAVPYLGLRPPGALIDIVADKTANVGEELLAAEHLCPLCTPEYARHNALNSPSDLLRATLIRSPIEPWTPWFEANGLPQQEPASGTRLMDSGLALVAAASGLGITLARPSVARRWLAGGELVALFDLGCRPATRYTMLLNTPADRELAAAAVTFADWLRQTCRRLDRTT